MRTRIQKWGNSLAVRIPHSYAIETKFEAGTAIELTLGDGEIVIKRTKREEYTLEKLLGGITRKNRHTETETGRRVGKEVW